MCAKVEYLALVEKYYLGKSGGFMATSGIVRRIDELGRIVIPKEIRRTMRLSVGDEMEILSSGDQLTLKRRGGFESVSQIAKALSKLLAESALCDVVIFDTHYVTQSEGNEKKLYKEAKLAEPFQARLAKRKKEVIVGEDMASIFDNVEIVGEHFAYEPICSNGDLVGGIALILQADPSENELCHLNFCARTLEASLG